MAHTLPVDVKKALYNDKAAHIKWKDITALAKNEFICWIISAKKQATRDKRIDWMLSDLRAGKRRPCCWAGCHHRKK